MDGEQRVRAGQADVRGQWRHAGGGARDADPWRAGAEQDRDASGTCRSGDAGRRQGLEDHREWDGGIADHHDVDRRSVRAWRDQDDPALDEHQRAHGPGLGNTTITRSRT